MDGDSASRDALVQFLALSSGDGEPFVLETQHAISLHFDYSAVQSFMSLRVPDGLALGYTRVMMGFLLMQPAPRRLCMIGLGGGSLVKYCYRHLPDVAIDAVEIDPRVIALRDVFRIPPDDERFRVICSDGADYVRDVDFTADVILLDAFIAEGIANRCAALAFFAACRGRLSETGVLAANFVDDDPALPVYVERLRSVFGASYAVVRCADDSNFVVFAWKSGHRLPSRRTLFDRAFQFAWAEDLKLLPTARRMKDGEHLDPERLVWCTEGQAHWEIGV